MDYGIKIFFKKLKKEARIPTYSTVGSAGCDLYSIEDFELGTGETYLTGLGFSVEMPSDVFGMITSRSGLAVKNNIVVINAPGIGDSDYTGEYKVGLKNLGKKSFSVEKGDRIAQLLFLPVYKGFFIETDELTKTDRGSGGFGSTGIK
jgi:dUTP pyrophosphatase